MTLALLPALSVVMPPTENAPPLKEREAVGLRLRRARKEAGLDTSQAAERAGISVSTLGALERGAHSLTSVAAGSLARVPAAFGLTWTAFVELVRPTYGAYIPLLAQDEELLEARDGAVKLIDDGMVEVPVYGMAAAHTEGNMSATRPVGTTRIPKHLLRENRHAYLVLGDSMDDGGRRGIQDGDTVLCDQADLDLREGGVFIVKVPGNGILLKRVRTYDDGETYLESDNRKYRPLLPDEAEIIGRVVWVDPQGFVP
jgi:repressor LexA